MSPFHPFPSARVRRLLVTFWAAVALALALGGVLSPASQAQDDVTATPTPAVHTIAAGETLSEIAEQYEIDMRELMALNGIITPNAIYVGQTLTLPVAEATATSTPPSTASLTATATFSASEAITDTASSTATATEPVTSTAAISPTETPPAIALPTDTATITPTLDAGERSTSPTNLKTTPEATTERPPTESSAYSLNPLHIVSRGDTISGIAAVYGTDADALRSLNGLRSDNFLSVGAELIIPASGATLRSAALDEMVDEAAETYTVQPGDSLSVIAESNDLFLVELMRFNGIGNPDAIFVGQVLTIPDAAAVEAMDAQQGGAVLSPRGGFYYYTLKPGESLAEIAARFDSTETALIEYNDLASADEAVAGMELEIPYGVAAIPVETPPVPQSGSRFVVSISRQRCWLYRGERVAYEWPCSTGYGDYRTRYGDFQVKSKIEMARSEPFDLDMPFWLGIYDVGAYENGIHGLPEIYTTGEKIWEGLIGQPATYGCAMLSDEDAAILFEAAYLGMPVHIID